MHVPLYERRRHYAGDITYTATGWLDKNKDVMQEDTIELLRASGLGIIASAFGLSLIHI